MMFGRQFAVFLVALGLLLGVACQKKKQVAQVPKTAPTLAVEGPDRIPEEALPVEPPPAQQEAKAEEPPPKKKPPKHRNATKPAAPPPANTQNNPTVAVNRPPAIEAPVDTAIAADVPNEKLLQQKQKTADLLDSTEKTLKNLNRTLTPDEEAMVTQVKSYITQSHNATRDGDYERAFNLAKKAQLLAEALVKK